HDHRRAPRHHAGPPRPAGRDARTSGGGLRVVFVKLQGNRTSFRTAMTDFTQPRFDHPPRPMAQRIGAILWPSFFAAGVCTMVFFAFIDPIELRDMTFPGLPLTRGLGYTIGFFMFWVATAASSLFTWILLRPASRFNRALPPD